MNELAKLNNQDVITAFNSDSLKPLLLKIEAEVSSIVPDVSTAKGRSEIKALAYAVTKSKTGIDGEAKKLVTAVNEQMKTFTEKKAKINLARKEANEYLSNLSKKTRLPLTEYEIELELKKQKDEILLLMSDAIAENNLFDKSADLMARENAIKQKEIEQQEEQDRIERDNKIREEEAAKLEQARLSSIASEKRALQAEKERVAQVKQNKIDADAREKQAAIDKEKRDKQAIIDEAERKKQAAINIENAKTAEAERIKNAEIEAERIALADKENVSRVKNSIYNSLLFAGLNNADAKKITISLCDGEIDNVKVIF